MKLEIRSVQLQKITICILKLQYYKHTLSFNENVLCDAVMYMERNEKFVSEIYLLDSTIDIVPSLSESSMHISLYLQLVILF